MDHIEDFESGVRSLLSKAKGTAYNAIESFALAKTIENACVVFEGDWGGQIYLTCPMKYVHCSEAVILNLLESIDKTQWKCTRGEGRGIFFEIIPVGKGVAGGMGGGKVIDGLWLHEKLINAGLRDRIADVIAGKSETIDL